MDEDVFSYCYAKELPEFMLAEIFWKVTVVSCLSHKCSCSPSAMKISVVGISKTHK